MPTVVVTGATRGIGQAAAIELARRGADVAIVGRDADRVQETVRETGGPGHVADLSRMDEVRRLAAELLDAYPHIDVLANNAGAMFTSRHVTPDGYEQTFALNHLSAFLLTNLLVERVSRVVTTSSDAHRGGVLDLDDLQSEHGRFKAMQVYGTSKLCNILFTRELQRRHPEIAANCFHPGVIRTGFGKNDGLLAKLSLTVIAPFLGSPETGAKTLVKLALESEGETLRGQYLEKGRVTEPSAQAQDDRLAAELWERSEALTLGRGTGDPVVAD
jgi:NAD(P)-dependent dehydrogenase (short-subunit alcohol dehydrogenase family)